MKRLSGYRLVEQGVRVVRGVCTSSQAVEHTVVKLM